MTGLMRRERSWTTYIQVDIMDKRFVCKVFSSFALGLIAALPYVAAQAASVVTVSTTTGKPCNNAMLSGRYGYSEQGAFFPSYAQVRADFAQVGTFTLDGKGGGAGMADISINGNVVRGMPLLNIAYTDNADCTGAAAFTVPDPSVGQKTRRISFALSQQGNFIHYISLEADLSSRGLAEKQ